MNLLQFAGYYKKQSNLNEIRQNPVLLPNLHASMVTSPNAVRTTLQNAKIQTQIGADGFFKNPSQAQKNSNIHFASRLTTLLGLSADSETAATAHPDHIQDHGPLVTRDPIINSSDGSFAPDAVFMPVIDKSLRAFPFDGNSIYQMEQAFRCLENLQAKKIVILYSGDYVDRYFKKLQEYIAYANIVGPHINPNNITIINVPRGYQLPELELKTEKLSFLENRTNDIHLKRNIALALAKMLNFQHIMFLDDDVVLPPFQVQQEEVPSHIRFNHFKAQLAQAFKESSRKVVGSSADGVLLRDNRKIVVDKLLTSDNSLLCLVNRILGNPQKTFIGGGAMSVKIANDLSFFPNTYNEDWLFMASLMAKEPLSVSKISSVLHWNNDTHLMMPSSGGVIREEFPDIFAESVLRAIKLAREYGPGTLDTPITFERIITDPDYWEWMVKFRLNLINKLQRQFERYTSPDADTADEVNPFSRIPSAQRKEIIQRVGEVLKLAKQVVEQNRDIWPDLLTEYANTWLTDQVVWQDWYANLPQNNHLQESKQFKSVLNYLKLDVRSLAETAKESQ